MLRSPVPRVRLLTLALLIVGGRRSPQVGRGGRRVGRPRGPGVRVTSPRIRTCDLISNKCQHVTHNEAQQERKRRAINLFSIGQQPRDDDYEEDHGHCDPRHVLLQVSFALLPRLVFIHRASKKFYQRLRFVGNHADYVRQVWLLNVY